MKKKYHAIIISLPILLFTFYLNFESSKKMNSQGTIDFAHFKTVFAEDTEGDPEKYLQTLEVWDAYCVDCWDDPLGDYQVNCKCDQYHYDCDLFEEGDLTTCAPYMELVISTDCEPTGYDC